MKSRKSSTVPLFILSVCLSCFGTAWAQQNAKEAKEAKQEGGKILDVKKLPAAVQKTIEEQTKSAKIVGLSKEVEDGKTQYELETTVNGRTRDMLIDPSGKLTEIEDQVDVSTLPAAVQAEVKKSLGQGKVLHFESVTKEGKLRGYEAARKWNKGRLLKWELFPPTLRRIPAHLISSFMSTMGVWPGDFRHPWLL